MRTLVPAGKFKTRSFAGSKDAADVRTCRSEIQNASTIDDKTPTTVKKEFRILFPQQQDFHRRSGPGLIRAVLIYIAYRNVMHPNLHELARRAMMERGFLAEIPLDARAEVETKAEPVFDTLKIRDLRSWLWSSIDNDESRDLDQIEYAQSESAGTRIYVGIADVDWFVHEDSMIDRAAKHNTTSVYTGVLTFPMLPEKLSTDLSSLNEGEERLAIVVEMLS
jgi:hypothetical protein